MEQTNTLQIIFNGLAAVGGLAGLAAFIKLLATLRNERKSGQIKNDAAVLESLKAAIDGFEDVIQDLKNERNEAKQEAHTDREERDAYRNACVTAEGGFCVNYGCPLRDPARGLGAQWIREHASSEALGGNYKNLPELMKEKGVKPE